MLGIGESLSSNKREIHSGGMVTTIHDRGFSITLSSLFLSTFINRQREKS
jgi:hypothetical protein